VSTAKPWPRVPISKVANIASGNSIPAADRRGRFSSANVVGRPFISTKDVSLDGRVEMNTEVAIPETHSASFRLAPASSTLVCAEGGSAGRKVGWLPEAAHFGNKLFAVSASSDLDCRFLFYFHQTDDFAGQFAGHLAGLIGGVSLNKFKTIELPVPPLDEQKRIVAVLDQAFAALDRAHALAEANLADAEELFENTLEAVFERLASSELILPLGEAVHPECRLSYGIVQPGDEVAGGLPIVRPVDLGRPVISLAGLKRISPKLAEGYSRTTLTGAELLLCVRGTTGDVSMASSELAGANVTRGIVPVRFDPAKVDLEFAYFQMRSPFMRKQITAKTYGAALMQINIKDVRELRFVRPSFDAQQKAKSEMQLLHNRANRMMGDYQAKLDGLGALRQSLLQKAFAGELT
jgi:type I restriction enzyme, S subunit